MDDLTRQRLQNIRDALALLERFEDALSEGTLADSDLNDEPNLYEQVHKAGTWGTVAMWGLETTLANCK